MYKWCGRKFTGQRWEVTTARRMAWNAGNLSVCGPCRADDVARKDAAAEAARLEAAAPPEPAEDPEPDRGRGRFRRRP
ncbi:hypothetical protein [Streptomyces sp. NPDC002343]